METIKTAINIGISSVLVISGMTVDVFPNETSTVFSYQQVAGVQQGDAQILTATGTVIVKATQPQFEDTDGNGVISVSVGVDKFGNMVFSQIDEETAEKMKEKDGAQFNPKIKYKEDAIDLLTETAQAAISFGSTTAPYGFNCSGCTSLTWSHIGSGVTPAIVVGANTTSIGAYPFSGVTYNGQALSEVGHQGTTQPLFTSLWVKTGITGTNNVVITSASSVGIYGFSDSYDGVDQTTPVNTSHGATTASTNITTSVTTTVDNAWLVASIAGNRGNTAGAGTTWRSGCCGHDIFDSNSAKTPAGTYSITATQSDGTTAAIFLLALAPAVDSVPIRRCLGTLYGQLYCN